MNVSACVHVRLRSVCVCVHEAFAIPYSKNERNPGKRKRKKVVIKTNKLDM